MLAQGGLVIPASFAHTFVLLFCTNALGVKCQLPVGSLTIFAFVWTLHNSLAYYIFLFPWHTEENKMTVCDSVGDEKQIAPRQSSAKRLAH